MITQPVPFRPVTYPRKVTFPGGGFGRAITHSENRSSAKTKAVLYERF